MRTLTVVALAGALLAASSLLACSSGDAPTPPDTATVATAVVAGSVDYSGPKRGMLRVALFESFPPTEAPKAVYSHPVTSFPIAYELEATLGDYFVVTFLDVDSGGYVPSPDDPISMPLRTNIAAGGVRVDVTLADAVRR